MMKLNDEVKGRPGNPWAYTPRRKPRVIYYVYMHLQRGDRVVHQAGGRDGARNIFDLIARTGCSTQCGRCSDLATEILEDELASIGAAAARPPVRLRVVSNS
jgi:bacterioferritin-associated ferredoxin